MLSAFTLRHLRCNSYCHGNTCHQSSFHFYAIKPGLYLNWLFKSVFYLKQLCGYMKWCFWSATVVHIFLHLLSSNPTQYFSHRTKHSSAFYTQNILSALFAPSHRFQKCLHSSILFSKPPDPWDKNSKLTSAKTKAAYLPLPPSIRFFYSGSLFKSTFVSGAQTKRKTCFRFHSAPFMLLS